MYTYTYINLNLYFIFIGGSEVLEHKMEIAFTDMFLWMGRGKSLSCDHLKANQVSHQSLEALY